MIRIYLFITIFLFSFSNLFAEMVNKLDISGNNRVSNETIKIYGDIKENKDYSEADIDKILKNLFSTGFFEDVKVTIKNNVLIIKLIEYPVVNQLILVGEPSNKYKEQIKKLIKTKEKKPYIKSNISKDIETIKKLYSSIGFNSSKVETKIKEIDSFNVDLVFEIDKGNESKISSINFIGDKKIKESRLRSIIASEEDKFWKIISRNTRFSENLINLDLRLLKNYYASIGYRDAVVNSNFAEINEDGEINLIFSIDAGKRYVIKKISTNADKVFDQKLFFPLNDIYKKYIGEYYSPFKIKKMLDELDRIIEDNNVQFVEHNVEEFVEDNTISIQFNVFEGDKFLVERIDISGNNITNENVIRGELLLDEGDPFTDLALQKSISRIKSRGIFKNVNSEVITGSDNSLKKINIIVEEKPTGEIAAGAGIGTNGGSFAIQISENNWLGEGKKVGLELEIDKESIIGQLSYINPNYNFLGNSISYNVASERNDKPNQGYENSIISSSIRTSFEQYKDLNANLGLLLSVDDLQTDGSASATLKKQDGTFSEITGIYGFSLDKRDRSFMPTSGSILSFNQSLPFFADAPYLSNTFAASYYYSLSQDVIAANKFYFSAVNGVDDEDVRISKRKGLSSKRLRGFQSGKVGPKDGDDFIGGNYVAAINLEANLPNLLPEKTNTDITVFLDFGNVWGVDYDSSIDDSNKIRASTGAGASWMSPIGPMTFTLSQNLSKASSDSTESFNFTLGTTF